MSILEKRIVFLIFLACDCNGFSTRCRFNEQLYIQTNSGGECLDCQGNRYKFFLRGCLAFYLFPNTHNRTAEKFD